MKAMPLSRIADWSGGELVGDDVLIDALAIDTRTLDASDGRAALFVAIHGERFDGHDHIEAAARLGARAALVDRPVGVALPQVVVGDTQRALATIAAALHRTRTGKVLAITGSNGKTSVKTMLLSIARQAVGGDVRGAYANPGNRNNEIGLPLAVIDTPDETRFAIYEMGAGKPGDIAYLASIVRPDVALVNNIAPAHLERMGSLLGIAGTKAAIYDALPADGVAVINADDAFAQWFGNRVRPRRCVFFGLSASADVTARDIVLDVDGVRFVLVTPEGEAAVALAMPGRHNVANALAAAAMALAAGIGLQAIVAGLDGTQPVAGRLVTHALRTGAVLIDDSYNANPASLQAAIDILAHTPGEHWLVLGDMRELGSEATALHAQAGNQARNAGIARLYALGVLSGAAVAAFGDGARLFDSHAALSAALVADIEAHGGARAGDVALGDGSVLDAGSTGRRNIDAQARAAVVRVLVKGSRGSAMDRVVDALLAAQGIADAA